MFILSERLSNSLTGSDVFSNFRIHKHSIHLFYNFIKVITFLYIILVISFSQYKVYMIFLISFSNSADVLPAFTCAGAIDNL